MESRAILSVIGGPNIIQEAYRRAAMPIALFDKDGRLVKQLVEVQFPDDELLSMGLDPARTEIAVIPGSDSGEAYKDFIIFMGVDVGSERSLLSFVRAYVIGYYRAYAQKLEHQGKIGIYGIETIPESERKRVTLLLGNEGLDIVERLGPEQAARLPMVTRGGDRRAEEIKQLWADEEVLKRFARLVEELKPVWTTIKSMVDPCDSREAQDEWLSSMLERPVIQHFMARYPKLTADVLRRAVANQAKSINQETRMLAYYHAALELEVQINDERLSVIDAYVKYQGKSPAPSSLETFYDRGKTLLDYAE
jgi:hypothetical protein